MRPVGFLVASTLGENGCLVPLSCISVDIYS